MASTKKGRWRSEGQNLAPQVGLEPTTLRLTAERLVAASRCKHKTWTRQNLIFPEIGGDSGGTLTDLIICRAGGRTSI